MSVSKDQNAGEIVAESIGDRMGSVPEGEPVSMPAAPVGSSGGASGLPPDPAERDQRQAMRRGWHRRCPVCGQGALFSGYLTVNAHCPVCGTELSHHRADDGPAYLTILIVGHILGPLMIVIFTEFRPNPWVLSALFCAAAVAMSLYLLPRLKGGLIGLQWAKRMHGFGTGD